MAYACNRPGRLPRQSTDQTGNGELSGNSKGTLGGTSNMSQEAELLRLIDSLVVELLAGRGGQSEPGRSLALLAGLADDTARCASGLALRATGDKASRMAALAREGPASGSIEALRSALEERVEDLQMTAERELEQR